MRKYIFYDRAKNTYPCDYCNRSFSYALNVKNHVWFCHSTTGGALKTKMKPLRYHMSIPTKKVSVCVAFQI